MIAESRVVSPDYFATMRIPLVVGERCGHQSLGGPRDVVVNRTFASRYLAGWPSAVGLHLSTDKRDGAISFTILPEERRPGD